MTNPPDWKQDQAETSRLPRKGKESAQTMLELARSLRARRIMCDGGNGNVYDIADEECEQAAEIIERAASSPAAVRDNIGDIITKICSHSAIDEAMEISWDDICTDTGCHPLDITHGKKGHLVFRPNHWANQIAKRLFVRALKFATPEEASTVPNFEVAALALGFQQFPNGKWFSPAPSPSMNTASTFDTAEDIFNWWGRASGNASTAAGEAVAWFDISTAPKDRVIEGKNANGDIFHVWWHDSALKGFPRPGGVFCVPHLTYWRDIFAAPPAAQTDGVREAHPNELRLAIEAEISAIEGNYKRNFLEKSLHGDALLWQRLTSALKRADGLALPRPERQT